MLIRLEVELMENNMNVANTRWNEISWNNNQAIKLIPHVVKSIQTLISKKFLLTFIIRHIFNVGKSLHIYFSMQIIPSFARNSSSSLSERMIISSVDFCSFIVSWFSWHSFNSFWWPLKSNGMITFSSTLLTNLADRTKIGFGM